MTDILIVEDHPTMRAAMLAVLEQEGFTLREAGDGPTALGMISERAPDVMFLDLHMPGVTGEEVLSLIETQERLVDDELPDAAEAYLRWLGEQR